MTKVEATSAPSRLRARRTRFELSATPKHWVPGDPHTSHMVDTMHVMLPPGERWFCDVFRDALPLVTDERLRDDVRGFIGQEATHAKAHDLGLEYLCANGIDLRREVAFADAARRRGRRIVRRLPGPVFRHVLNVQLAVIAAVEHATAVLGGWILDASALDDADADPVMLDLLRWHGAEEVEHRSVAFDLYQHLDGNRARRAVSGYVVGVGLTVGIFAIGARIMRLDPDAPRLRLRDHRRAVREGRLPWMPDVARSYRQYAARDHHPSRSGSSDLALAYLATSLGVTARRAS
jgi:predicted metal-dependent hydrolase